MGSQFFWESIQKARGSYFCDHCCNYIEPDETYHREAWAPRRGVLHIMRRHTYPSECPPNIADEIARETMESERVALGVPIVMIAEVREVLKTALNGDMIVVSETHFTPTVICEASPHQGVDDDSDEEIPF